MGPNLVSIERLRLMGKVIIYRFDELDDYDFTGEFESKSFIANKLHVSIYFQLVTRNLYRL